MRRDKRLKKLEHCRVEVAKTDVTFQFMLWKICR